MNFKNDDIIVRCYKSGKCAIGIYCIEHKHNNFILLDNSFDDDGGLTQYQYYSMGEYTYRTPTNKELIYILKILEKDFFLNRQEQYYKKVSKYTMILRKNKLKKLNEKNKL